MSIVNKNLSALNGSGVESAPNGLGLVTLTATDVFYFPIQLSHAAKLQSIHIQTTALIAGTFTIEACNFPKEGGADVVTDYDETSGGIWVQVNSAVFGVAQGVGTGWAITVLSLVKTAGTGSAIISLINPSWRRFRVAASITTTGTCRVVAHGKE